MGTKYEDGIRREAAYMLARGHSEHEVSQSLRVDLEFVRSSRSEIVTLNKEPQWEPDIEHINETGGY